MIFQIINLRQQFVIQHTAIIRYGRLIGVAVDPFDHSSIVQRRAQLLGRRGPVSGEVSPLDRRPSRRRGAPESLREGGQPQGAVLLKALLVCAAHRNHEMDVRNTHGIGHDIEHAGGLYDVALADVPEHAANLDVRLVGTGFKPLADLLRKH